jgi:hypothetical protein
MTFGDIEPVLNVSGQSSNPATVIGDGLEQQLDLGVFGILSAAANNVLNVNLSVALATGNVRIIAMGTEE